MSRTCAARPPLYLSLPTWLFLVLTSCLRLYLSLCPSLSKFVLSGFSVSVPVFASDVCLLAFFLCLLYVACLFVIVSVSLSVRPYLLLAIHPCACPFVFVPVSCLFIPLFRYPIYISLFVSCIVPLFVSLNECVSVCASCCFLVSVTFF